MIVYVVFVRSKLINNNMCLIYGDYVLKPVIEHFVLRLYGLSPIIVNKCIGK